MTGVVGTADSVAIVGYEPMERPVDPQPIVTFAEGLIGCPDWQHFSLSGEQPGDPIRVLQSLDEPTVSLLAIDPFAVVPDYEIELSDADEAALGLDDPSSALVLCILTVRQDASTVTANLLGPIVINRQTGLARQLVLAHSDYSIRHPVLSR